MNERDELDELQDMRNETGPGSAGQSGDLQGIEDETVSDLLEEGQAFEAGVVSGLRRAAVAGDGGIRTREVPEDDVPLEYLDDEIPPQA